MKTLITLGQFLKALRVINNELLYDMAKKLEVGSAYLSQVENHHMHADHKLINNIFMEYVADGDVEEVFNEVISCHLSTPLHTLMKKVDIGDGLQQIVFISKEHKEGDPNCECNECNRERTEAEIAEKEKYEELGRAIAWVFKENSYVDLNIETPDFEAKYIFSIEEMLKLFKESQKGE